MIEEVEHLGDALQLHKAIAGAANGGVGPGVSPKTALAVGLKVDVDALPAQLKAQLKAGKVNLDDPATTLALLSFLACSMALLMSQSRGAFVAVAIAFLLYLWLLRSATIVRSRALYLGFLEFVHNIRKRGKALLGSLIGLLVAPRNPG